MDEVVDKKALAAQLKEAANLIEVLGEDPFRARAFQSASRQLEAYEGDFAALYLGGRLTEIRGVGAGLAAELSQPLDDAGLLPLLAALRERVPEGVRDLFRVSGLGAKKVKALWGEGVEGLDALIVAVDDGRVAALKGFGAKSAEKFRAGAAFAIDAMQRWRADDAELLANELLDRLRSALSDARFAVVGEVRRACNTAGAIELLATDVDPADAEVALAEAIGSGVAASGIDGSDGVPTGGERRSPTDASGGVGESSPRLDGQLGGRRVTLHLCRPEAFGAALAWHTGSPTFRESLRASASAAGLTLDARGLHHDGELIATPEEHDLFAALDLPFTEPELREQAGPMPVEGLVTLADIRGLVHNHTVWSDAVHSVREMVAGARERGFAYLALADHSVSSAVANGLSPERVIAQAHEVAEVRAELAAEGSDFELLHGIEVDIRSDGSLDYDDEILALLDYTVVSVHQNFTLSEAKQTERIVRAVRHPRAHILGHASGRLLLRRPPYAVDLRAVIEACAESGTVIEINASPYRLDLDWRWVREARALGCTFSIDPDAHRIEGYDDLVYGVRAARKAGLTAADVVNTAPTGRAFLARLKGA